MTLRGRLSVLAAPQVLTGLWTVFVFMLAYTADTNGSYAPVFWWAVFPLGWVLGRRSNLSAKRRRTLVVSVSIVGSGIVLVGAWMAWPSWGPLYTGGIPSIHFDNIERGYQLVDLPLIGVALGGSLGIFRSRRELRTALIALGSGFGVFLWTVSIGWFWGRGLWGYAWGYDVTLGGAICLVYVGLFCLSFVEQWPSVTVNQLRARVHALRQAPL